MTGLRMMLVVMTAFGLACSAAEERLYVAAGGALEVHTVDAGSGKLTRVQKLEVPGAGPFSFSPDRKWLHVSTRTEEAPAAIATLAVGADGTLAPGEVHPVRIRPGSLRSDREGRFLAGNHYRDGKATIWKLEEGRFRGDEVQQVPLEEKAHDVVFSPDNRWLLVPATGPNKVFVLRFDEESGRVVPNDPPFSEGPSDEAEARQPRHLLFHPSTKTGIVYTTNERERPGVAVWRWNAGKGVLEPIQNIVTQPEGFAGRISTATLRLTPGAGFLYVSNRDGTDRQAPTGRDSIVGFRVDPASGRLELLGHTPCERVPRSFAITPSGRFLIVAGQGDSQLGVYRIDRESGALARVSRHACGARPSWIEVQAF